MSSPMTAFTPSIRDPIVGRLERVHAPIQVAA